MFKRVKRVIDIPLGVTGELAKGAVDLPTRVVAEVVASTAETVFGENSFSEGVREMQEGVSELAGGLVDGAVMLVGGGIKHPLLQAERGVNLGRGLLEMASGNPERGAERTAVAALGFATGGLLHAADLDVGEAFAASPADSWVPGLDDAPLPDLSMEWEAMDDPAERQGISRKPELFESFLKRLDTPERDARIDAEILGISAPKIEHYLGPADGNPATYYPGTPLLREARIELNDAALEKMQSENPDAVKHVVAHETGHHYQARHGLLSGTDPETVENGADRIAGLLARRRGLDRWKALRCSTAWARNPTTPKAMATAGPGPARF